MKRCEICGSPFHRTQSNPNWLLEYLYGLAVIAIVIVVVLAVLSVLVS